MKLKLYKKSLQLFSLGALSLLCLDAFGQRVTVTSSLDFGPGTLRGAVEDANPNDTIEFGPTAFLPIVLTGGVINVDKPLVFEGNGMGLTTISGIGVGTQLFNIVNAEAVQFIDLTLSNGEAEFAGGAISAVNTDIVLKAVEISGCTANGPEPKDGGGAVYIRNGSLSILMESVLSGNSADGTSGSGGAVMLDDSASITVRNSTFSGNSASRAGGAIESNSGLSNISIVIINSTFENNSTASMPGNGGALHITGPASAQVEGSEFDGNQASAEGGAMWNGAGNMMVDNCTFSNNEASGNDADQGGGAIYNLSGSVMVTNSSFSGNAADGDAGSGGAILNDLMAKLFLVDSEFTNNSAQRAGGAIEDNSRSADLITVRNCVFTNNSAGNNPGNGGAIHITGAGDMTIENAEATDNSAVEGGAFWNGTGSMIVNGAVFENNVATGSDADQGGGALYNLAGKLTVASAVFTNNQATGESGSGGAILNDLMGELTVQNCQFTANQAQRAGGAIEDNSQSTLFVDILNCRFTDNLTGSNPGNGGAIHITGSGNMRINDAIATGNVAANEGGAFWNGSGTMAINRSRMDENEAQGETLTDGGGSLFNNGGTLGVANSSISNSRASGSEGAGGGASNLNGIMTFQNVTISGNFAHTGGAVFNNGRMGVLNCTVVRNTAEQGSAGFFQNLSNDELGIKGSIVAGNTIDSIEVNFASDSSMVVSNDYNLFGINNMNVVHTEDNDLVGDSANPADPEVLPLDNNGGNTFTHSLSSTSIALNAGDPADFTRGQTNNEVANGRRDIGAYQCPDCEQNVGIFESDKGSLNALVYPNPLKGSTLFIETENTQYLRATILDISGKTIMEKNQSGQDLRMNLNHLETGTYILKIDTERGSESTHIIKQ